MSIPLGNKATISDTIAPRPICRDQCQFWIQDCEVGLRASDVRKRAAKATETVPPVDRESHGGSPGTPPLPEAGI